MIKASKFQKNIIAQIEKIGEVLELIEGVCTDIEKADPILVSKMDDINHYSTPIRKFTVNHRTYTIWYNEMRDFVFSELANGGYIIKNEELVNIINEL